MERELKFLLSGPRIPPLPVGYHAGPPDPTLHLRDEYLDDRGQLLAAGWRLRRRQTENAKPKYTLKSEGHPGTRVPMRERREIERVAEHDGQIPRDITSTLNEAGVDTARLLDRLQPYLTLDQARHSSNLTAPEGEVAILSVDEVCARAIDGDREQRWTELEVEFLPNVTDEVRDRTATDLAAWLGAEPGVTLGGESKAARATRLLSLSAER
jgi:inorganic triphosphatase YgiF